MSTSGRELLDTFDHLSGPEKREVASEIIRRTFALDRDQLDEAQVTALYAEFACDDRRLAEEGIADYERGLVGEDAR
ncbi:MAG: hypothetical protein QOE96_354 [Blastocatellia bacterium]|jgi:hypothetical protein|nr:hypothetical protein [Blastocatellia bacterium]